MGTSLTLTFRSGAILLTLIAGMIASAAEDLTARLYRVPTDEAAWNQAKALLADKSVPEAEKCRLADTMSTIYVTTRKFTEAKAILSEFEPRISRSYPIAHPGVSYKMFQISMEDRRFDDAERWLGTVLREDPQLLRKDTVERIREDISSRRGPDAFIKELAEKILRDPAGPGVMDAVQHAYTLSADMSPVRKAILNSTLPPKQGSSYELLGYITESDREIATSPSMDPLIAANITQLEDDLPRRTHSPGTSADVLYVARTHKNHLSGERTCALLRTEITKYRPLNILSGLDKQYALALVHQYEGTLDELMNHENYGKWFDEKEEWLKNLDAKSITRRYRIQPGGKMVELKGSDRLAPQPPSPIQMGAIGFGVVAAIACFWLVLSGLLKAKEEK